jgi:hypothetical protein
MRSARPGKRTSIVEVIKVSPKGVWLLIDREELFASYRDFPWFRDATIDQIRQVKRPSPSDLHWSALDVDVVVESLRHPRRDPLLSQVGQKPVKHPAAR